jgi:hypothetical protein
VEPRNVLKFSAYGGFQSQLEHAARGFTRMLELSNCLPIHHAERLIIGHLPGPENMLPPLLANPPHGGKATNVPTLYQFTVSMTAPLCFDTSEPVPPLLICSGHSLCDRRLGPLKHTFPLSLTAP